MKKVCILGVVSLFCVFLQTRTMESNDEKIARLKKQLALLAQDIPGNKFENPLYFYMQTKKQIENLEKKSQERRVKSSKKPF